MRGILRLSARSLKDLADIFFGLVMSYKNRKLILQRYYIRSLRKKKDQFRLSIESKVEHPEMTINSFNNQFQLNKEEKEAVEWAMPLEFGQTMFHVINVYTKAAQYPELPADSGYKLQKVGGMILEMVK